ncbi:SspB-related isopeptide-forming adhesin [Lactococcus lactis]|uniref:SspB-related isopeptide-forming adhesin n=1 Tax=Lactococcus lactis TaxID=1358 RepID=UPI002415EB0F|nr:SspB-related isopeptide-forming adhesin [Lactococcus lactis]MDG4969798.1 cell surface protein [Lactococcus lactis]MDG5103672.1 cell surface protein [Lactococcus lactis]
MKKTLKDQLLEVSKAHLNWKKKSKVFFYGTAILLMVAPSLVSSVSRASADEEGNAPKVTQAGEHSGKMALNVSHTALDQAISDAKAAGLTLKEDATQDKGNAQGSEAISKLQKTISDDYASQTSTIQKQTSDYKSALAKYNQAEADYKKKLDDIQNAIDNHEPGAPAKAIGQGLNFKSSQNPNAVIKDVKFSGAGNGSLLKSGTLKDGMGGLDSITASSEVNSPEFYTVGGAGNAFGLFLDKGQSVTITYSNLKSLTVGKTAAVQIKATFKNPSGNRMGLILPKDPGNQFHFGIYANGKIFTNQPQAVQQTYQFYDALGKIIPFITTDTAQAQFMVGSLNYSKAKTQDGGMPPNDDGYNAHESASFDNTKAMGSPFGRSSISQVSGVPISGSNATGDSWGVNPSGTSETWSAKALNDYKYNGALMDTTQWDTHIVDAWYGAFSLVPKDGETSISVTWHTTSANMWASFNGQLPTKFEIPTPPIPPVKPTATYHYDKATFQTDNIKSVTNAAGTDVNGALVNKNAIEDWHLTNEDLPAGHEVIKNYSIEDKLPDFFVPDLVKCKALNPTYDVSFDEKTNTVTLTANKAMLEAMNKDLNSAYKVPTAILEGQVTKDNSSYENNFDTFINDYTVKSNNVEVHTPDPKPEKTNENGSGTTINGQGIDVNATNYYKLLWNTSAYKGAKPTKEDIDKGFFFVDDAPEIVDVDMKNISYKDSNGNAVPGITAKLYPSLNDAPAEVQKALKNSNISPKGQFVFYSADNPQDFFTKYYEAGNDITITQPMTFKEGAKGDYENTAYQIDFGNGYTGDTVKNTIVPPKVTKQVSVDGGKTWHDSKDLPDTDSNYDYKLDYEFTANGDYTKILFKEAWESSQYVDLANIKLFTKDGKEISGTKKVVNESGKDVTEDYNKHVFQKDGKKEKLYIVFTPDKISDITSLASNDDPNRLVNLTLSIKDVTLKGASGAELANYLEDGKIVTPNTGELITASKTVTGDNTKDEVTKSNVTKVIPPQLTPMINKYVYETGVGSSINLYDKGVTVPSYLSKIAQFTSLNLNKDEKVKVGDTVHWLVAAQSGNKSLMTNVVDTLPKELSFAENPNIKVFVLKNDGKLGDEVTSDWKIETKGQTLTATPNDPTKYFFVGSSTDSRVVITLDTTLNDDTQSGSFTNVATINTKDGGHKEDKANIHTKVDPVKAIVDIYLPKTGDSKSIMTAVGAWFVTVALVVGVVLNERKRHTLMTGINKFKRHIKL